MSSLIKSKYYIDKPPFLVDLTGENESINILSYNLHGLNQGRPLLEDFFSAGTIDFCLIQEHWLTPHNLGALNVINQDYGCISSSAMEDQLSNDILRGRPYGGVAIFYKNIFADKIKILYKSSRVIILLFDDIVIVNVYFPSKGNNKSEESYNFSVLEEIFLNINEVVSKADIVDVKL